MKESMFIYGELLLPVTVIEKIHQQYFNSTILNSDNQDLVLDVLNAALKYRSELQFTQTKNTDKFQIIPVKINSFFRAYTVETNRGTQLQLYKTQDETKHVNGLLLNNITLQQKIEKTPSKSFNIPKENINIYPEYTQTNLELPQQNSLTVKDKNQTNWNTTQNKDLLYTSRIYEAIENLAHIYSQNFAEQFYQDFTKHTYETPNMNPFIKKPKYI